MSPEQLLDPDSIDARSDLFALGAMLYEALSGRSPFAGTGADADDKQAIGIRITMRPHPPLLTVPGAQHVPSYVAAIVERLLEKSPADRYRSAEVVADLLERALAKYEHDLREKGLTPQPLSKLAEVPRRPQPKDEEATADAAEAAASASSSTSTSPFVSISLPPEEVEKRRGKLRRSGPRARSLAYASTEKMAVGAYTLPQGPTAKLGSTAKSSEPEEGRMAMLPYVMGAEEVADEDIEEVVDEAPDEEQGEARGVTEWGFESVAKLDRAPVSEGPGSGKERMFDPEAAGWRGSGEGTLAPHAASYGGERARPTMQVARLAPQRSVLTSVLVVLSAAFVVAALGLVILFALHDRDLRRADEARLAAGAPAADAGALARDAGAPDAAPDGATARPPEGRR